MPRRYARARRRALARRRGKIIVLLAVLLPTMLGIIGLVLDVGFLTSAQREAQHAADAAATLAAKHKQEGVSDADAQAAAIDCVQQHNGLADAGAEVHCPPQTGSFAGSAVFAKSRLALYLSRGSALAIVPIRHPRDDKKSHARFLAGAFFAGALATAFTGLVFTAALVFAPGLSSDFLSAAIRSITFDPRSAFSSSSSPMILRPLDFFFRSIRSFSAST